MPGPINGDPIGMTAGTGGYDWTSAGVAAGMGLINNLSNLAFGEIAQRQQLRGQKQALEQQNAAAYDLWQKTNYSAQKQQMKMAGLNPAMLYGMSGGGGATTGTGGAMPTSTFQHKGMDIQGAAQLALIKAQTDNINADTRQKNVEATKTEGVDTTLANTQISKLRQETLTEEQKTLIATAEAKLKDFDQQIKGATLDKQIEMIWDNATILDNEAHKAANDKNLRTFYWDDYSAAYKADLTAKVLQNQATQAGIALTGAQIQKIAQDIQASIISLKLDAAGKMTDRMRYELDKKIRDISDSTKLPFELIGSILKGVIIAR